MSDRNRLDVELTVRGLTASRSQAESWIKLGKVTVNGRVATKSGIFVPADAKIALTATEKYVSRAGLKLASVAALLHVDFRDKIVLDVGSSTGGFTDYSLQHGAKKVIAVDVGTEQLHPSLRADKRIDLHEKTDIRDFSTDLVVAIVVIDVSFISLRDILPSVRKIAPKAEIVAMVKPQFEAGREQIHKGIIKNDAVRRHILQDFEQWAKQSFAIRGKRDSEVAGSKGNRERFYLLRAL